MFADNLNDENRTARGPSPAPIGLKSQLYLTKDTPLTKRPGFKRLRAEAAPGDASGLISPVPFGESPVLRPRLLPSLPKDEGRRSPPQDGSGGGPASARRPRSLSARAARTPPGPLPPLDMKPATPATPPPGLQQPLPSPTFPRGPEFPSSRPPQTSALGAGQEYITVKPWYHFLYALRRHPESLEFVYLSPISTDIISFDPYDLEIVSHSDIIDSNFYTMSSSGVTHFVDGMAEFTPLDQWEREYHLYNQISKLNVFRQYKKWKGFGTWKRFVRKRKTRHCRAMLERYLFLLNPIFQRSLCHIRMVCYNLSKLRLHDLQPGLLYTLPAFCQAQAVHREKVQEDLAAFSYATVDTVREACGSALVQLEERLFGRTSLDPDQAGGAAAMAPIGNVGLFEGGRTKGQHAQKNEDDSSKFTYAITAAKRSEQRRLLNYIRLVDYMVCDTLRVLLVDSISDMLEVMKHHEPPPTTPGPTLHLPTASSSSSPLQSPKSAVPGSEGAAGGGEDVLAAPKAPVADSAGPVFEVEILMREDTLVFSPSADEYQAQLEDVVAGFLEMVGTVQRLLTHDTLKSYVDQGAEVEMSGTLVELITDDTHNELLGEVKDSLGMAFEDAEGFKATFRPYRDMVLDNRAVNTADMRHQVDEGERTLDTFREDIARFNDQHEEMTGLVTMRDMGIIRVNTQKLRDTILPSPKKCLALIAALLPKLAAAQYQAFITEIHDANIKLSSIPASVEEFVEFVNFLTHCLDRREDFDTRYANVTAHYELMEEFQIAVPEIEYAAYQTLAPDFASFKTAIDVAEASKEEHVSKFASELEKDVEQLNKDVVDIRVMAQHEMILDDSADMPTVLAFTKELLEKVQVQKERADRIKAYQKLFNVPPSRFDELVATCDEIELKHQLWESLQEWGTLTEKWAEEAFDKIDVAELEEKVQKYNKVVLRTERGLPPNKVVGILNERVHEFKETLPVIQNLRNPALKERHWEKVEEEIGQKMVHDEGFTLGTLLSLKVMAYKDKISLISTEATQEATLEQMLQKVQTKWNGIEFAVVAYKDSKDSFIFGSVDEVTAALEDSMVTMTTITASRFVSGIRNEVEKLEKALRLFSDVLDEWLECQKNWMYLESIFTAPDIQRQLPFESKAFFAVDKAFKDIMRRTRDRPNALMAGTTPGWLETFQKCNETLERVQKNLEEYLETKRMAFPRFYFLSNDELLEILSQTKNVQAVQPHMSKCFDGIRRLDFGDDPRSIDIFAMISGEGERVSLGKNLKARGNVEVWLTLVEQHMASALRRLAKKANQTYHEGPRSHWVLEQPAQLVITISQIFWCTALEQALTAGKEPMQEFLALNISQLTDLTKVVQMDISALDRRIIVPLITIDVHARDIVSQMVQKEVSSLNDFDWQMQLRFYWDDQTDEVSIKQVNASFSYGYEYLGAQSRLVVTPMTDRCYMTLTGALHLKLGGAPAGPAGTGKTETTKDLGKALGVQCVVFNCGDNLDYKFMGKFFSGLAQCGAWACFDEFNRIDIEVLSVVAQQLLTIQNALKAAVTKFIFEGKEIRLIATCGVFITMNPGYAGRTELPDNLKALFRPMSMMVPDYALIAEVMLFSEGFADASLLSRKMVKLYKLSSEQLSQQDHYDFGLRALKSVLVMAGSGKRNNPTMSEATVLIRAMRDSNLPKFLSDDTRLFQAIIADLFPGVKLPEEDYGELQEAVVTCIQTAGLQPVDVFVLKVVQLFETFNVRFGVMLVGPSGGGKTRIYEMLQGASTLLHERGSPDERFQTVRKDVLNPKCIKMGELYGEYNLLTNEWTDGLGSTLIRQAVGDTSMDRKWVVFDGPVDAIWIENMNTVLDDNCTLCLPNGERIKLNPVTMRMLFEVLDLAVASPATVSRCGMVYVPADEMGWRPYAETWLQRATEELSIPLDMKAHIWGLFGEFLDAGLAFVRQQCKEDIPSMDINLITSLTVLLQALIHPSRGVDFSKPLELVQNTVNYLFVFSFIWSIGGNISSESQEKFDEYVREMMGALISFPGGSGTVYDYFVDAKDGSMRAWEEVVPAFKYRDDVPYFDLMVPTVDTTRYSFLLELLLDMQKPTLFTGMTGVGKTAIMHSVLTRVAETSGYVPIFVNFSAQTTALATQTLIESKLEKKRKTRFGAPVGKKIACFVDDVNMPMRERYGAQPPVELLRQFLDFGGLYDRKKLFWKDVEDTTLLAACAPPGGGRNEVTPRFMRHFNMFNIAAPSDNNLRHMFGSILTGFLTSYPPEFKSLLKPMVDSTVEIFNRMQKELLPTPAKSHYTFNLRDVSRVFQGILMMTVTNCQEKGIMTRLWVHENMRVFHDRLINTADKKYFMEMVFELLQRNFALTDTFASLFEEKTVMFGDYLRMGATGDERYYEEVVNMAALSTLLEDYLNEYNLSVTTTMKLVFFRDAIEHLSRISRILRQPRGNALLVGVGGSGKQSLTRFACFMAEYQCFQIELTRGYAMPEFREDLKKLFKVAGIQGTQVAFLFTDTQIVNEGFVEDVNNLLNTGEVPGLFAADEKERVVNEIRAYVVEMGLPETRDSMYAAFINRVRQNLHVVLCMSPVGEAFRSRCRQFPSLINCCTIDWYNDWPEAALLSVSTQFLSEVQLGEDEVKSNIAGMCVSIHLSVTEAGERFYQELRRRFYTTPKSYLDLINLYVSLLAEKRDELTQARDRLLNGLHKLRETNTMVDMMRTELNDLQPILKEKTEITKRLLVQVTKDQEEAVKVRDVVGSEETEVKKSTMQTQAMKDEAQADLDEAMPALKASIEALNALNKQDITEIKSFQKPPIMVQKTMEAVCTILQEKPDWDTAKKVLSDVGLIKRLVDFDKDNMPEKVAKAIRKYIDDPTFTPEQVAKQSNAAKSLCLWVHAMDKYAKVAKVVAPKKAALARAQGALLEMKATLKAKQDQLQEVENQVAALRKQLEDAETEEKSLQDQAEQTRKRLIRAGKLTTGLADEEVRWAETAASINVNMGLLVGDVFVGAACISYYGPFTGQYRAELVNMWTQMCEEQSIPVSEACTLRHTLSNPVEVREWNIWGLPTDDVSIDNGILVTRGRRWPLMIDPQGQANKWVKNMEAKNGPRVTKLTDPNFIRTLENSIRIGNPVLLEDIGETLDPALEPILQKQIFKQGNRLLMRIGDSDVDYDPGFKLYLTTKLPNPHYLPEVCIKVTIINFTVTMKGLEDQLLGDLVRKERPDLEETKDRLVINISSDKKQLKDLEDKILKLLKESEGNILDDELLINTLNNSKLTSSVIQGRVKEAEETEMEINNNRELYRVVPVRGSILYFVVADLALVDPMYQYSLHYFTMLFNKCIDLAPPSEELETRLQSLMTFITEFVYRNVCRGLFEEHKLIFSFLICSSVGRAIQVPNWIELGKIDPPLAEDGSMLPPPMPKEHVAMSEWNYLLRGPPPQVAGEAWPGGDAERPSFISKEKWYMLRGLAGGVESMKEAAVGILKEPEEWAAYCTQEEPFDAAMPGALELRLTAFQNLLLVKAFHEEKLVDSLGRYVGQCLGEQFVENPPFNLEEIYVDTSAQTPIIFILSTGADPTGMLQRFGDKMGRAAGERLQIISLGQGQGPIAENTIAKAKKSGDWVCLQNCHLASSWMQTLEKLVESLQTQSEVHDDFRLWLTSMPTSQFPVPVLQNGIKVTNEPPKGVRANLLRSYTEMSQEFLESCSRGQEWRKLVFACAFFHAILQERRKFGPIGWNIKYDFSNSDLECSLQTLKMFLEDPGDIPWTALVYVTGQINYGGRVTDDLDRRCLMSILKQYYTRRVVQSDSYTFSASGSYRAPPDGSHQSYLEYIRSLPLSEAPEVFGMHQNANITFRLQETRKVVDTVLSIQPRLASTGGAKTPDEIVGELASEILESLPEPLSRAKASPLTFALGYGAQMNSLGVVIGQELDRFNRLLKTMRQSLTELERALRGLVVMSGDLEVMYDCLLNNQVPDLWTRAAYPSLKPLAAWVSDFMRRVQFMRDWLEQGPPKCYWLPGLFFPQGFLTGVLQNHARKYQIAIDTLDFGFSLLTKDDPADLKNMNPVDDGVLINGLFLDGARWDTKQQILCEANPGEMFSTVPVVHFTPHANYSPPTTQYQCPLYKTAVRAGVLSTTGQSTNYVLSISLPLPEKGPPSSPDFWVLQGVAALCALS